MKILQTKIGIEKKIENFLDQVSQSGMIFQQGMVAYLSNHNEDFERKLKDIRDCEHAGDSLRRSINEYLYQKTLIPESRGDVLELLENMDSLLDRFKGGLWRFSIEQPEIPFMFHEDFHLLMQYNLEATEALVASCRSYFHNISAVSGYLHKVSYWESECDKVSTRLQTAIFSNNDLRLSHKRQLQDFARHLEKISDRAEDIADRLNIYVIKRSL